jgi:lipoate-protein ligase A
MGNDASILRVLRAFDGDPATDLAREEALVRRAAIDGPALLLYGWNRPVLVLGYGQDPATVDRAACGTLGVPVLRRITGGTGVLHGEDLAASLVLPPQHPWVPSIPGLYLRFLAAVAQALQGLGVSVRQAPPAPGPQGPRSPICFEDDRGETLWAAGRKSVGCAQARRRDGVLIHGMILRGVDAALQAAVYGTDPSRILKALGAVATPPPPRAAMADAVAGAIASALGLTPVAVDAPGLPEDLRTRYSDSRWAPTD